VRVAKVEAAFLRSIVQETITVVDLQLVDYERMTELVEVYADFPLGTTDAAVVAVAERLGITEIATLDRRHFYAVRPRHADNFDLLPDLRRLLGSGEAVHAGGVTGQAIWLFASNLGCGFGCRHADAVQMS
jgi:hypothetical protein